MAGPKRRRRGPDLAGGKGRIYLAGSHVVMMTLPLHPTIRKAWLAGKLTRVEEDGSTFRGDPYQLPGKAGRAAPPAPDSDGDVPERPKPNAARAHWAAYAVALGAADEDEAATLTRDQLVERCTAPEDQPGS